tara:strand:- start:44 stop:262 length:219 start_codon:yes stop_codon:yes gene_type:complete
MLDQDWKEEYKLMKKLKPMQIKLLDEGAQSLSQSWLVNAMWCDWKELKSAFTKGPQTIGINSNQSNTDPWYD